VDDASPDAHCGAHLDRRGVDRVGRSRLLRPGISRDKPLPPGCGSRRAPGSLETAPRFTCDCARQKRRDRSHREVPKRPPTAGELGPCRAPGHAPSTSSDRCQPGPGGRPLRTASPAAPSFGRNEHHQAPECRPGI
jgi:hypothetical protein